MPEWWSKRVEYFLQHKVEEVATGLAVTALAAVIGVLARRLFWNLADKFRCPTVVFVSTGGTCRDPMAKVILQELAKQRGIKMKIYARGVGRGHSKRAAKAARLVVMEKLGQDLLSKHRTKRLRGWLAQRADLILTMEGYHAAEVKKLFRMPSARQERLLRFWGYETILATPIGKPTRSVPKRSTAIEPHLIS